MGEEVKIHINAETNLKDAIKETGEARDGLKKLKEEEGKTSPPPKPAQPQPKPAKQDPSRSSDQPRTPGEEPKTAPRPGATRPEPQAAEPQREEPAKAKERAEAEKAATNEIREQQNKLDQMRQRIADLYRAAEAYEAKGMDTAAQSARSDARGIEREMARETKARAAEEKEVTRALKEQDALRKAGVSTMRQMTRIGMGALAGEILPSIVELMAANETLSNRRVSTDARNHRQMTILNSIRGTSGQVSSEAWAAEENVAQLRRERPQLETEHKFGTARATLEGAGWGAGIGATIGSIIPGLGTGLGALIGGGIGAGVKGIPAYFQGQNRLKQSAQDQQQEEERARQLSELAPKLFMEQEGGLQLDKLRQRAKRSLEGSRAAFVDEMAESWLNTYRDIYNRTKGNDSIAKEMADLNVANLIRDRQAHAGASLVDARSGGAEIAAASRWAIESTPAMADVATKIDALHTTVQAGNQSIQLVNQAK